MWRSGEAKGMKGATRKGRYKGERRGGGSESNPSGRSLDQERKRDGFSKNRIYMVALSNALAT